MVVTILCLFHNSYLTGDWSPHLCFALAPFGVELKNQNKGGLKAASDRRRAGDLLKALYTNGIQKNVQFVIELVDEWECTWPRPLNRTDVDKVQLLIKKGGVLDLGSWNAACH